jgi:hypothetical protein
MVCNKFVIAAEIELSAELCVLKLYCLQRICNSLLKLSCLQRINIHCRFVCFVVTLRFVAEVELSATIW